MTPLEVAAQLRQLRDEEKTAEGARWNGAQRYLVKLELCGGTFSGGSFQVGAIFMECVRTGAFKNSPFTTLDAALIATSDEFQACAAAARFFDREGLAVSGIHAELDPWERLARAIETMQNRVGGNPMREELSKPMSKAELMSRLGLGPRAFGTFCKSHKLQKLGRQQWQIQLSGMDSRTRQRIETGK